MALVRFYQQVDIIMRVATMPIIRTIQTIQPSLVKIGMGHITNGRAMALQLQRLQPRLFNNGGGVGVAPEGRYTCLKK